MNERGGISEIRSALLPIEFSLRGEGKRFCCRGLPCSEDLQLIVSGVVLGVCSSFSEDDRSFLGVRKLLFCREDSVSIILNLFYSIVL